MAYPSLSEQNPQDYYENQALTLGAESPMRRIADLLVVCTLNFPLLRLPRATSAGLRTYKVALPRARQPQEVIQLWYPTQSS